MHADSTPLDDSAVVHKDAPAPDKRANNPTAVKERGHAPPNREAAPSTTEDKNDCLQAIRKALKKRGISGKTADIILSSWREGTKKTYATYIRRWLKYCDRREKSPLHPTEKMILEFLTNLYEEGKGYNSLCLARSAIMTLPLTKRRDYELVRRFLKGAFNSRPVL